MALLASARLKVNRVMNFMVYVVLGYELEKIIGLPDTVLFNVAPWPPMPVVAPRSSLCG